MPQRQVVFSRAALVTVTLNDEIHIRMLLQEAGVRLQDLLILLRNVVTIVVEEHVFHVLREQLRFGFVVILRRWRGSGVDGHPGSRLLRSGVVLGDESIGGRFRRSYGSRPAGINFSHLIDTYIGGVVRPPGQGCRLSGVNRIGISRQGRRRCRRWGWWRWRWRSRLLLAAGADCHYYCECDHNLSPLTACKLQLVPPLFARALASVDGRAEV